MKHSTRWHLVVGIWAMAQLVSLPFGYAEEKIKLAVAGPFTGAYAPFGEQMLRGAMLAVADSNAKGGVLGRQIELIKGDDACEPKQALSVANRLVELDKVVAVDGHFCSSSTMPASEVYAEAGVLMITPASTNPMVTERNIATVFRSCGRDDQQGSTAAEFIVNILKAKKVAVIHDKDTYGQGLADAMKTHMQRLGSQEVLYEGLTRGEKDFNALVTKIKAAQADAVYFGGLHNEAGPLVRQMREQGLPIPFVSGDGIVSEDFVLSAGGIQLVKNVFMTFGADPRSLPSGANLVQRFRDSGYEPEGYTLYSYATIEAMIAAIQATGSTNGEKMAQWLHTHPVQTVMGEKIWDQKGDLTISDYVMYEWDASTGKYKQWQP